MRRYEGRTGIEWIRDEVREAYRKNGNELSKSWTSREFAGAKLSQLMFVKPEDFSVVIVSNKPPVVRIECQNVFPQRDGPLALEVNLSNGTETWIEPERGSASYQKETLFVCVFVIAWALVPAVLGWYLGRRTALSISEKAAFWSAGLGWWSMILATVCQFLISISDWDGGTVVLAFVVVCAGIGGVIAAVVCPLVNVARGWGLLTVQFFSAAVIGIVTALLVREIQTYKPFAGAAGALVGLWVFLGAYSRYKNWKRERVQNPTSSA